MAGTPFPFALSALPGRPGESQGDLLNAYALKNGSEVQWVRVPGLDRFTPSKTLATRRIPRGQLALESYLVSAAKDRLEFVTVLGTITTATGVTLVGDDPVTMARNQRLIPQIIIVSDDGSVYITDPDTQVVSTYPDAATVGTHPNSAANLGGVTAVCEYAGYFVFTRPDGTIVASDLNNAGIPDLSRDTARHVADGAYRPFNNGQTVLIMGDKSIEFWADAGTLPFPLQFASVANTGLMSKFAVAGGPSQWDGPVLFAASDYTVRLIEGYTPQIVSNVAVQRDLYDARWTRDELRAQVYSVDGQPIFALSHLNWCWCYNLATGGWHRRSSYGTTGWFRGQFAANFNSSWYMQDLMEDGHLEITPEVYTEDGNPLIAEITSAPLKDFPASVRIPRVLVDCSVGLGRLDRPATEFDPAVLISWSHNGGASWSNPLIRSMGQQGRFSTLVQVNNLGRSTHQGIMLRLTISDPVRFMVRGAIAPTLMASRARQVAR